MVIDHEIKCSFCPTDKRSQGDKMKSQPEGWLACFFFRSFLRRRKGGYKERAADAARYVKGVFGQTSQNQRRFGGSSVSNYY